MSQAAHDFCGPELPGSEEKHLNSLFVVFFCASVRLVVFFFLLRLRSSSSSSCRFQARERPPSRRGLVAEGLTELGARPRSLWAEEGIVQL